MSEAKKGKALSEEHKRKLSESRRGKRNHNYGKQLPEEVKKKISNTLTGRKLSEKTKKKISESLKGENNPNYGKHLSEESKRRISECNKGRFSGEKNPFYGIRNFGETNPNWKGGRSVDHEGYIHVRLPNRDVREHRLIVENVIGRKLKNGEVVHHLDENRINNVNTNLLLCLDSYHQWLHRKLDRIRKNEL